MFRRLKLRFILLKRNFVLPNSSKYFNRTVFSQIDCHKTDEIFAITHINVTNKNVIIFVPWHYNYLKTSHVLISSWFFL